MMRKGMRIYDPDRLNAEERHRANVIDLFASNTVSAKRAQELIDDAYLAETIIFLVWPADLHALGRGQILKARMHETSGRRC